MHNGLGLPLPVCWLILDMAEYWLQIRFTDPLKLDQWNPNHRETMKLRVDVPEVPGFKAMQKVVLAIGGHNIRACCLPLSCIPSDGWAPFAGCLVVSSEGFADQAWSSFEVETGGDLPVRSVTHHCPPWPYWEQDIPAVHLISWRRDDNEETRQVLARLRPKGQLNLAAIAPQHALWMEHVVLLRVEMYYTRA